MHQSHWDLGETPFRGCLDPRFFYHSPTHEEALARLHFLVDQRRRLGLLIGEGGSGKSLLLEVFAEEVRRSGRAVAKLSLFGREPVEVLWELAAGLGLSLDRADSPASLWWSLADRLAEYRYQQLETVVLLDDADLAGDDVLTHVARLAQHDRSAESRLTMVLVGRPQRISRLGGQLLELAELRIDVQQWEQTDTEGYLRASMAQVGRRSPIFAEAAVARLHQLAHGVPRSVTQLAELALVAGAGEDLQQISAEVVESACRELGMIEV